MLIPLGFLGTGAKYDFELISTQVLSSTQNVTFSSIPQGYKHLQLRITAKDANATAGGWSVGMRFNGVTTSSYTQHQLIGNGASASSAGTSSASNQMLIGYAPSNTGSVGQWAGFIVDILDYTNANKNSVFRSLTGVAGNYNNIGLFSGAYLSTAAVNQIDIFSTSGYVSGSRFSLYGVRG